jgi:hypothetical protein
MLPVGRQNLPATPRTISRAGVSSNRAKRASIMV